MFCNPCSLLWEVPPDPVLQLPPPQGLKLCKHKARGAGSSQCKCADRNEGEGKDTVWCPLYIRPCCVRTVKAEKVGRDFIMQNGVLRNEKIPLSFSAMEQWKAALQAKHSINSHLLWLRIWGQEREDFPGWGGRKSALIEMLVGWKWGGLKGSSMHLPILGLHSECSGSSHCPKHTPSLLHHMVERPCARKR